MPSKPAKKFFKRTLAAAGGLLALVLVALGIFIATFDPNAYKPLAIDAVQERYQRTLAIPGPITLSIFPRLAVKLGAATLSERASTERFAAIESAEVSLALWPLIARREVLADRIVLAGVRARVVRHKDGKLSIDDLLAAGPEGGAAPGGKPGGAASPPSPGRPPALVIGGLTLTDAELVFEDRQAPRRIVLSRLGASVGRIAPGVPIAWSTQGQLEVDAPRLGSELALQGSLLLGPAAGRVQLDGLQAELKAQLGALAVQAKLQGRIEGDTERRRYSAPALALTIDARSGATPITARLALPFNADLAAQTVHIDKLELEAKLPNPKDAQATPLALAGQGALALKLGEAARLEASLNGQFDQSRFNARVGMPRLSPASYTFDVELDRLDVDRYRSGAASAPAASASAAEKSLDLSALHDIEASGQLRIGALQMMNLKASQLRAGLRAGGGRLSFAPLAAELYQGQLAGSAGLVVPAKSAPAHSPPQFTLQPSLTGVAIGPLLKDLTGNDRVLGRGQVTLDVTAAGATVGAILKSLAGNARVELKDGALRGVNIAQSIRRAKAAVRGGDGIAAKEETTDFSELAASFRIAGGVAHNEDLALKSPLLRIGGAGDIDLAASRLDYLVKATIVGSLKGQGGAELDALRGQTIPVKLTGPFDAITWKIDFGGMLREAAEARLEGKKEELKDEARRRAADALRGLLKK